MGSKPSIRAILQVLGIIVLMGLTACNTQPTQPHVAPTPTPANTPTTIAKPTTIATFTPAPIATIQSPISPLPTPFGGAPLTYGYRVVNEYPHDPTAFTQGLVFDETGILYEGTGLYGESTVRRVDLESGTVEQQVELPANFFGEGITIFNDKIYQLTWREKTGFVYQKETLQPIAQFSYPTEGWGLTHDGETLWMSDGSANLYTVDPATLEITGQITVKDGNGSVANLNELEYVAGLIYANVWKTDRIVMIDPASGEVTADIDLGGIYQPASPTQRTDVLNGIVYNDTTNRLYVTGKWWDTLFEIELIEP